MQEQKNKKRLVAPLDKEYYSLPTVSIYACKYALDHIYSVRLTEHLKKMPVEW